MEEGQKSNGLQQSPIPMSEKIDLSALINAKRTGRLYGPSHPASPRPIEVKGSKGEQKALGSFLSGNVADAMTQDFVKSISGSVGYNDNVDMDQQNQEFWSH